MAEPRSVNPYRFFHASIGQLFQPFREHLLFLQLVLDCVFGVSYWEPQSAKPQDNIHAMSIVSARLLPIPLNLEAAFL